MEKKLFVLLFLTGIVPLVQSIPRKFYLIQESKIWTEAQTYCRTKHTDLATIETPADMIQLQAEAQQHQFSSSAWVGLYKVTIDWRWSFNNEPLGSWTTWTQGWPSSAGEACVIIYVSEWLDYPCTYSFPFMCYDGSLVGDSRYIFYSNSKPWYEAQSFCRTQHSDLVTIRDAAEQSIVAGKIPPSAAYIWIGLYRNKTWLWSDQTSVSTITWAPGEPANIQGEDCGSVENGLISDTQCSVTKPFFCYSVITGQQQMIRMKLQSDQDLNDPAVQAVILEQIQQNLKHHGIANVTVKFREQPGGAVFYKLEEKKTAV